MADIGTATIRILADSKAFEATLSNLSRTTGAALDRGSRGLVARANTIGRDFGERLGESASRWLRRGLVVGAAGIAAAVGGVLAKGFRRFTTIEDATASLTLLLDDAAEAADLVAKTLKVVEGTPFGLDQFVDAARNLAAANIEVEKIPRILSAVADAAAAAGGSTEDVDNVVDAIGRLATGAELTLGPIRDLEQLGVPALRILANQAGKTTRQMAKDISAGTVDSKKAIDDLTEGILNGTQGINDSTRAYGGAAKLIGEQVSGAWDNIEVAVARAGAKVIDVFAQSGEGGDGLVKVLRNVRDTIDILGDRAVAASRRIVGSDGFGQVLEFFEKLPERVKTKGLVKGVLEGIREGFNRAPKDLLGSVISTIIIRSIEAAARFTPQIVAAVVEVAPQIIAGVIQGLLQAAADHPLDFALFIGALGLPGLGPALAGFFSRLPFGFIVAPLLRGITGSLQAGARALGLATFFQILGDKIALGVVAMAGPISAALVASLTVVAGVALGILINQFIEKFFPEINRSLEKGGAAIFDFFVDHVFPFFTETIPNFFTETIPRIVGQVVGFFAEMPGKVLDGIGNGFSAVFEWFGGLSDRIRNAIGDIVGRMFQLGRDAIGAIKDGAVSIVTDSSWANFWEGVGADIVDFFSGPEGIDARSPSKKFLALGRNIVDGLRLGVEGSKPALDAMMAGLVPPRVDLSIAGATQAPRGQVVNHWTLNEVGDAETTAERVLARQATG